MPYHELQVPPRAREAKEGLEVLRAAVIDGGLHVTLRRAFDDPSAWGVLLADVAHQVARVYGQEGDKEEDVLTKIRAAFATEVDTPLSEGSIGPIDTPPAA